MQIAQQLQDRRTSPIQQSEHWQLMNAEQKMALYSLHRFGYRLLFVRHLPSGPLAIIAQQDQLASICSNGNVDYHPSVQLRD
ncbi:hypothetical protein FM038_002105 [Shewanella eurypsychrophilus]|uniref:Uncharacterized protein n=1 Tax=Shewanella eurypsychrophilus TaxID=2593656 RepID=A0ABX6V1E5_9GAMM|nr:MULTISPECIES: hypothetical protein [Shewanella]QFU21056.1 hypothetical protein FS418_03695 [Shewanella sp. YLB-09]QPG56345.1 hypothetical protein FM038_002105 [Shewanella eurypsychrophilus]